MSHLTARPPPLRRPLAPEARMPNLPSPPETDSADSAFQNNSVPSVVGVKPELEASQASQPRRTSTLSYHTSLLDGRAERTSARASKWLVAVVPSDTLTSHMSATGHRVSQGTLMPLFPTFYAQCTALAREFGFPSVVGLAIFIHITTQGITMTPRVSEETWQILWSHLFDARSPSSYVPFAQLPVGGRIEIDVDMQKARWFESWVHSRRRTSVPPVSAAPSVSHWRGDSRTTFPEEHADDRSESLAPPRRRHVPRQLSLLDKIETASIASSGNQNGLRAAPEVEVEHEHDLSTAIPEVTTAAIPTAGSELASRVKSWRASSSVAPSPMAATRQVSLDPVHMPNGIDLPSPPMQENDEEIRLEDFQWSVSSEGPGDYDYGSIYSPGEWSGVPSVHLDRRLEGSIMLSPTSIATSWGPVHDDDYVDSPHDWENGSSVDLTRRLEHSVPPSPSVATSWGPDDHEHHEHHEHKHHHAVSHRRNRSLHLADRGVEDSPKTPTTATSWGPGSYADDEEFFSLPQSPSTPHIADRCRDEECDLPQLRGLASVWPALAPSSGPSSVAGVSFPYFQPRGNDLRSQVNFSRPRETTSRSAFPYFEPQAPVSHFVWPFFTPEDGLSRFAFPYVQAPETESRSAFPYVQPQDAPSTWNFPYLKTESAVSRSAFPHLKLQDAVSSMVWPYHQALPPVEINLARQYPSVAPYGLVYPFFEIYPGTVSTGEMNDPMRPVEILLKPMSYPFFQVYPDAKPQAPAPEVLGMLVSKSSIGAHQNFYTEPEESPGAAVSQSFAAYFKEAELAARPSTVLPAQYPYFSLYPAVYPMFEIYPGHVSDGELDDVWRPIEILLKSMTYPVFEIYPDVTTKAAPAAPEILGMLVSKSSMGAHMNFYTEPEESPGAVVSQSFAEYFKSMEQPSMVLPALYPNFSIYPAQYPYFEIYPGVICNGDLEEQSVVPLSPSSYPIFQIYQGHFSTGEVEDSQFPPEESPGVLMSQGFAEYFKGIELSNRPSTVLQAQYPFFSIYPAQYPIFEIYPGNFSDGELDDVWRPIEILLKPMRYPVFEIYPDATSKSEAPAVDSLGVLVSKSSMGAHMNYYSDPEESPGAVVSNSFAAYFKEAELAARPSTVLPALYPTFSIYPAVYPIFEIYPGNLSDGELDDVWRPIEILLKPMSYPFFEIYPKVSVDSQPVVESLGMLVSKSSMGAHMNFYTAPEESPGFVVSKTFAEFFKGVVVDLRSPSDPQALYPVLSIYPAQYPFFEIYPGNVCDGEVEEVAMDSKTATADALGMLVSKSSMGAHLNFYSAQEESPGLLMSKSFAAHLDYGPQVDEVIVTLGAVYPHFNLYPAQYPVFDIYPSGLQTASPAKRHVPMGLRIKKTHAMLHSEVFGFPVRRMHRSHAQLHDEVASALRPASPEYASILRAHENRRTSAVRRSSNASESSPSGGLSTQATAVNKSGTLSPRRTGSAESMSGRSPRGFVTGHRRTESSPSVESTSFAKDPRPTHRRTQSAENAESAGNQAGRRRDPPPVALRAPIAANRPSHTSHAPPPPAEETSHFEPEDDVPEELLPPQRRRLPEHATSKNGLPSNPTVNRIHAPPPAVPQSQYPHNLSPVQERPPAALQRSISPKNVPSQSRTTLSRAASIDGVPHAPRRRMRDSLVSERAKMFDSGSSAAAPVSEPRRSLDETPKSKAPPVPPLPPSRSFSASVSRIVHKLDRSKFPFS